MVVSKNCIVCLNSTSEQLNKMNKRKRDGFLNDQRLSSSSPANVFASVKDAYFRLDPYEWWNTLPFACLSMVLQLSYKTKLFMFHPVTYGFKNAVFKAWNYDVQALRQAFDVAHSEFAEWYAKKRGYHEWSQALYFNARCVLLTESDMFFATESLPLSLFRERVMSRMFQFLESSLFGPQAEDGEEQKASLLLRFHKWVTTDSDATAPLVELRVEGVRLHTTDTSVDVFYPYYWPCITFPFVVTHSHHKASVLACSDDIRLQLSIEWSTIIRWQLFCCGDSKASLDSSLWAHVALDLLLDDETNQLCFPRKDHMSLVYDDELGLGSRYLFAHDQFEPRLLNIITSYLF